MATAVTNDPISFIISLGDGHALLCPSYIDPNDLAANEDSTN